MNSKTRTLALHVAFLFLLLYGLSWALLSSLTFFSNDTALRFEQIQQLIAQGWQSFAVTYAAQSLDPSLAYVPFYYAYSVVDEQIFLQISSFLPFVTSLLYPWLGTFALPLVPVVGGVLTAVAMYRLAVLTGTVHPRLLLWATVLATPLLFYSLELWDHSIAVAFLMCSVTGTAVGVIENRPYAAVGGGVALALAFGQRPEAHIFAIALAVGLLVFARSHGRILLLFLLGALGTALIVWGVQWVWTTHPLGMATAPHLLGYGVPDSYPFNPTPLPRNVTISRFVLYSQGQDIALFGANLLIVLGIVAIVFAVRIPKWQKRWLLWVGLGAMLFGYAGLVGRTWPEAIPGIMSTFPLVAISLVYVNKADDLQPSYAVYQFVLVTAVAFIALMVLVWPTSGGTQWGARYLLPAYPLLLFLAFYVVTIQRQRLSGQFRQSFLGIAASLLIASMALQVYSVGLLASSHKQKIWLQSAIAALPVDLILTNNPFIPAFMVGLDDKQFLYVDDVTDLAELLPRMQSADIRRFALVTDENHPLLVPPTVGEISVRQTAPLVYELEKVR
jgi:hypothetical protein